MLNSFCKKGTVIFVTDSMWCNSRFFSDRLLLFRCSSSTYRFLDIINIDWYSFILHFSESGSLLMRIADCSHCFCGRRLQLEFKVATSGVGCSRVTYFVDKTTNLVGRFPCKNERIKLIKVHLSPNFFISLNKSTYHANYFCAKIIEFG